MHTRVLALVALFFAVTPAAQADLVAHYTFDETLDDSTANANHGVFAGGDTPTWTAGYDGTANGAIAFDGADDIVNVATGTGLPVSNEPAFSVVMWVRGAAAQNDKRVFSEASSSNNTPLVNIGTRNTGAVMNSYLRPGPGARQSVFGPFDGTWHQIAWVDNNGQVDFYVDGVRDPANMNYTRPAPRAIDRTSIGGIQRAASSHFFTGDIDEVSIYNHALTEDEVQAMVPTPGCPDEGDTHCSELAVDHDGFGGVTATATASDDGGDDVIYTFTITAADGSKLQYGPQVENSIEFTLARGTWTIAVTVDDDLACFDEADDATVSAELIVDPEPQLIAKFAFDNDALDASGLGNDGVVSGDPTYVEGFDGTPLGALEFDGDGDLVEVTHTLGLPLYNSPAHTVAMWVKGPVQRDKRVFSESNTSGNNTPLVNVGTHNSGANGALDIFMRPGNTTLINHAKSSRPAFDDTWHHIAWVDDNGQGLMYIDGVLEPQRVNYSRPGAHGVNATTIGGILRGSTCCLFTGAIDDVCLFNYALSAEEIADLIPEPEDCAGDADTHCDDLTAVGPEDETEGEYTVTMTATDGSGDDPLWYTFWVDNGETVTQIGPQNGNEITRTLTPGMYTITATVDDVMLCRDAAEDASCTLELEVLSEPEIMISGFALDGDLLDSEPAANDGTMHTGEPTFTEGVDCTENGALALDGSSGNQVVLGTNGLPVTGRSAFTIAMWVKGPAGQDDKRFYSESNTVGNGRPLFNLGTGRNSDSSTDKFSFYYRGDNGVAVDHPNSTTTVFDDTWHHFVWSDDNGTVVCYIDGVPDATDFSYARNTLTTDVATIGGILRGAAADPGNNPSHEFTGAIDGVMIFNYAIEADEVAAIYGDGPAECCDGPDTQCSEIAITSGLPGIFIATVTASDDSGDPILYTITADNGVDDPVVVGPQESNQARLTLTPGSWTITASVDDDPDCDQPGECSTTLYICDGADTTCDGLTVVGPEGDLPGEYTATAAATDADGDAISYVFTADNGVDDPMVIGPQESNEAVFTLDVGAWTISVAVDDDADCDDAAGECSTTVEVLEPGIGPFVRGDCNGDGAVTGQVTDAVFLLAFNFTGGDIPGCMAACDANGDGAVTGQVTDAVYILNFNFTGGIAPPAPFPECANSTLETDIALGCDVPCTP